MVGNDAVARIGNGQSARDVGADLVALDGRIRRAQQENAYRVAGNQIAGAAGVATDLVIRAIDLDADSAAKPRGAGGIGANEIALDDVAARASLCQHDTRNRAQNDVASA